MSFINIEKIERFLEQIPEDGDILSDVKNVYFSKTSK